MGSQQLAMKVSGDGKASEYDNSIPRISATLTLGQDQKQKELSLSRQIFNGWQSQEKVERVVCDRQVSSSFLETQVSKTR